MSKPQFFLLLIAVLLTLGLYQLPKVVVSNNEKELKSAISQNKPAQSEQVDSHSNTLSEEMSKKLQSLKNKWKSDANTEKRITFADSIADLFRSINRLDSAAFYLAYASQINPTIPHYIKAGNGYFEAFRFALSVDADKANQLGEKAREFYQKVLEQTPENYTVKANVAMTYVATQTPMRGIQLLQEILAKDSKNELAIFNLGILAIQSGQTDKAIQRFESLLAINPGHLDAKLYLAKCFADKGKKNQAIQLLKEIAQLKEDSLQSYKATAEDFLKELTQ